MKKLTIIILLLIVLFVSCATAGIPERKNNNKALLVIPVTLKGGPWKQGFSFYTLDFGGVAIKLFGSEETEYIAALVPAGEYSSYHIILSGFGTASGDTTGISIEVSLKAPFVLNPGEVFIFPDEFIYSVINRDGGIYVSPGTAKLDKSDYRHIRDLLLKEENIEQWEIPEID
ncbi:MAG: hypothetical protein JW874_15445 [Spirochaetales bacterium]|nr:hypothetical protein [Spirochaetales bacterium]